MEAVKGNLNKGHTMFMDWKTQHGKDVISPKIALEQLQLKL